MNETIVPMIHVPDVRATVQWYQGIGFALAAANEDCGEMNWARLTLGRSGFMLSSGGLASSAPRREVDLYVQCDDIDGRYERVKDRAEVVEGLHDTFYGMREFIVRDCNRFWVTFGQPIRRAPDETPA